MNNIPDRIAKTASIAALLVAATAACGRVLDVELMSSFLPGVVGIKPVTITAFVLASIGLLLDRIQRTSFRFAARACGVVVTLIATLSLAEYFFGADLLLSRVLFSELPGAIETVNPGRMAPNTAVAFLALGIALILLRSKKRFHSLTVGLATTGAGLIALQVLIGYAYGARGFRGLAQFSPMAFPTALNFALLTMAVIATRRNHWPTSLFCSDSTGAASARLLFPVAMTVPFVTGWLRLRGEQLGWYATESGVAMYAMTNILTLAAVVLWSAQRLHRADVARNRHHQALQRTIEAQDAIAGSNLRVVEVMRLILANAQELTGADGVILVRADDDRLTYASANGTAVGVADPNAPHTDIRFASEAIKRNEPVRCDEVGTSPYCDEVLRTLPGRNSLIAVPLRSSGTTVGALLAIRSSEPFSGDEADLLQLIAPSAASALIHSAEFEAREALVRTQTAKLATLDQTFAAFMSNIPAATFVSDSSGRYVYGNPSFERIFGIDLHSTAGASHGLLSGKAVEALREANQSVLTAGTTTSTELRLDNDGETRYLLTLSFPIRDGDGAAFAGGVAVDITEQKLAEGRIAELNETLESRVIERTGELATVNHELEAAVRANQLIMEHSLDVVCTVDEQGQFVFLSAASESLWGYKPQELVGRKYIDLVHPEDHVKTNQAAADIMAGQPLRDFENRYIRRDGALVPTLWSAYWSATDKTMFCVAHDITERKRIEAALEAANKELESFSYSVSHDLRAPLRAVDGYTRMLEEDYAERLDDEGKRFLQTIRSESQRMAQLIDDLLSFSRSSRRSLSPSDLDIGSLADEVLPEVHRAHPDRVIEFLHEALPHAEADRATMRQVLVNLLSNAAKYAKADGPIRIEMGARSEGKTNVYWIRDHGVGFDMRYVNKLFQVFQRLHTEEEFEGTGIGLAIVDRIVTRHGGRCWAEGEPGKGACFFFSLPARHEESVADTRSEPAATGFESERFESDRKERIA